MSQHSIRHPGATFAVSVLLAQLEARVLLLAAFVGSMWLVYFLSAALPFLHLNRHGVVPRTLTGLQGILFAPWLHASLVHLIANTSGLVILGWLCMCHALRTFGRRPSVRCWAQASAPGCSVHRTPYTSARAAWCLATPATWSRGYYTRHILAMLVALFVAASYGLTMLFGLMPLYPGVSWQSHLGGALGGILAARAAVGRHSAR
jgi:membrane associated rhomboid family serine protease